MSDTAPRMRIAAAFIVIVAAIGADVVFGACSAAPYTPSMPEPKSPEQVRIAINSNGLNPISYAGPRALVSFVNNDVDVHEIRSNPHPAHTDCAELNIGRLQPGQVVAILNPFEVGRSCGYHDETRLDDARFQGSIVIR